jgi:hypothetical protein
MDSRARSEAWWVRGKVGAAVAVIGVVAAVVTIVGFNLRDLGLLLWNLGPEGQGSDLPTPLSVQTEPTLGEVDIELVPAEASGPWTVREVGPDHYVVGGYSTGEGHYTSQTFVVSWSVPSLDPLADDCAVVISNDRLGEALVRASGCDGESVDASGNSTAPTAEYGETTYYVTVTSNGRTFEGARTVTIDPPEP